MNRQYAGGAGQPRTSQLAKASLALTGMCVLALLVPTVVKSAEFAGMALLTGLALAAAAVIIGLVSTVMIVASGGRTSGLAFSIPGTVVAGFLLAVTVGGIMAARERARRTKCASNLKMIGYGVHLYSSDWNEQFPESLEVLFEKDYLKDRQDFRCPSRRVPDGGGGGYDYEYVKGVHAVHPPYYIVAYDKEGNHPDGRNVLLVGGRVQWTTERAFQEALEKTEQFLKERGAARPSP